MFRTDISELILLPLGLGVAYYLVPVILNKPIRCRQLSLFIFWVLAFFGPLMGIGEFLYSPIPRFLQTSAVVATLAVEMALTIIMVIFFATLRGSGWMVFTNHPLRWLYTGMLFYFVSCLQGAIQVTWMFQQLVHFTDWDVGHTHLVMAGAFACWLMGIATYLLPRLFHKPWHGGPWCEAHYWLSIGGLGVMVVNSNIAGVLQGYWWGTLRTWTFAFDGSRPFWIVEGIAGFVMFVGQVCLVYNIYRTWRMPQPKFVDPSQ